MNFNKDKRPKTGQPKQKLGGFGASLLGIDDGQHAWADVCTGLTFVPGIEKEVGHNKAKKIFERSEKKEEQKEEVLKEQSLRSLA